MGNRKVALITGVTGQDGAYLAELLLAKGYKVHGIKRRASLFNTDRIDHLYQDPHVDNQRFVLHYGDLTDSSNLIHIVQQVQPDEIYNLAAQSHVAVTLREARVHRQRRRHRRAAPARGDPHPRHGEEDALLPGQHLRAVRPGAGITAEGNDAVLSAQPYAVAKLYAYWITVNYREAYGLYACNGILFNHESPVRGETFVTRKITRAIARIALGLQDCLYLGNLCALRDWGHARDYVEMLWLMLQQPSRRISSSPPACSTACGSLSRWRRSSWASCCAFRRQRRERDRYCQYVVDALAGVQGRRCGGARRPALLPADRSRDTARRPQQSKPSSAGRRHGLQELVAEMVRPTMPRRGATPGQERRLPGLRLQRMIRAVTAILANANWHSNSEDRCRLTFQARGVAGLNTPRGIHRVLRGSAGDSRTFGPPSMSWVLLPACHRSTRPCLTGLSPCV